MEPKPVHQKQNEQFYNRKASPETMPDIPERELEAMKALETQLKRNGTMHRGGFWDAVKGGIFGFLG